METRRRIRRWLAAVVAVGIVVTLMAACGGTEPETSEDMAQMGHSPALDGQALLEGACVDCHDLERTTSESKTRDAWLTTVERMVDKGASLSAEEVEALVDYLAEEYGP